MITARTENGEAMRLTDANGWPLDDEEEAPATDAVPVVRCVDCCYFLEDKWNNWNDRDGTCCWWEQGTMYRSFCSYGERRTDNGALHIKQNSEKCEAD